MIQLKEFGEALRAERMKASYSLANFAKHTGGISKDDIRDFEEGKRPPDKLTLKKIVHCFPILMQFEHVLRAGEYAGAEQRVKHERKPKRAPSQPSTRLAPPPRELRLKPRLEIVRTQPAPLLQAPLEPVLRKALSKTPAEVLGDLARLATKKLAATGEREDQDFTIKNDGKTLIIKLWLIEGEERVDSGCYLTVSERMAVFCKTMTNGNYCGPRAEGVVALLETAKALHNAVKDRE